MLWVEHRQIETFEIIFGLSYFFLVKVYRLFLIYIFVVFLYISLSACVDAIENHEKKQKFKSLRHCTLTVACRQLEKRKQPIFKFPYIYTCLFQNTSAIAIDSNTRDRLKVCQEGLSL